MAEDRIDTIHDDDLVDEALDRMAGERLCNLCVRCSKSWPDA